MFDIWPWLALIGLGAFHGLNPAMGWLFAVALGYERNSRNAVLLAIVPIALGHAAAIAVVVYAAIALGAMIDAALFRKVSGALLIAWGVYHATLGHRHEVQIGLKAGLAGLGLWSFLMALAHGAGMMLIPVLMPLGQAHAPAHHAMPAMPSWGIASLAVIIHSLAMLVVTGLVALLVYGWLGREVLKRRWVNLDLVWTAALIAMGLWLILS